MNSKVLTDLFTAEAPRLRRLLRRFGPQVSPDDIVQESFARLCSADQSKIDSPRAYLFRTAHNLALNDIRRTRSAPFRSVAEPELLTPEALGPSPEQELVSGEEMAQMDVALAGLPEHLREALLLYKIEGLHHRDIARRLGVTERSVRRYIADALARCHVALCAGDQEDEQR